MTFLNGSVLMILLACASVPLSPGIGIYESLVLLR